MKGKLYCIVTVMTVLALCADCAMGLYYLGSQESVQVGIEDRGTGGGVYRGHSEGKD